MYLVNYLIIIVAVKSCFVLGMTPLGFCPTNCICKYELSCQNLETIPSNLADVGPPYITSINMSYNEISVAERGDFTGLHSLKSLDLSHNKLSVLWAESFQGLWQLTYMNISHNEIEVIEEKVFDGLVNLSVLNLSYNRITSIFGGIFEQMVQLKLLDLSHNNLKVLLSDAFSGLNELEVLYIHNNHIRYIEANTIVNMRNLKSISIRENSGHCDCPWIHLVSQLEFNEIVVIDKDYFSGCGNLYFQCIIQSYTSANPTLTAISASPTDPEGIPTEITPPDEDVTKLNRNRQLSLLTSLQLVHLDVRDGILFNNGSSTSLNISSKEAQEFVLRYDHAIRNRINKIEDEKVGAIMSRLFHRQMSSFIRKYFELDPSLPTRSTNQNHTDGNVTDISRHLVVEETSVIAIAACIPIISFLVIYFTLQYVYEARKDKGYIEISSKNSNQNQTASDESRAAMSCCCARCLNAITTKLAVRKKYVDRSLEEPASSRFREIHEEVRMEIDKNKQETKPTRKLSMVSSLRKLSSTMSQKYTEKKHKPGETAYSLEGNHLEPEYCRPRIGSAVYSSDDTSNSDRSWDDTVMLNTNANHSACSDPNDTFFEEIELP